MRKNNWCSQRMASIRHVSFLHPDSRPKFFEEFALKVIRSSAVLPTHYAFILDGNGRCAEVRNQSPTESHKQGFDNIEKVSLFLVSISF